MIDIRNIFPDKILLLKVLQKYSLQIREILLYVKMKNGIFEKKRKDIKTEKSTFFNKTMNRKQVKSIPGHSSMSKLCNAIFYHF